MAKTVDESAITATIEDYLERILILCEEKGYAQVTEIAKLLDISKASVTEMVNKMKNYGLVKSERYGTITLTDEGKTIAEKIKNRHDLLETFLLLLGISEENAKNDACVMEHNLSKETAKRLEKFILFLQEEQQKVFITRFREQAKTKS